MVAGVRHVGKEGNDLETHQAGLVTEAERQIEYHDSSFADLVAKLQQIPTKVLAEATGYNPRTVRRLKRQQPAQNVRFEWSFQTQVQYEFYKRRLLPS